MHSQIENCAHAHLVDVLTSHSTGYNGQMMDKSISPVPMINFACYGPNHKVRLYYYATSLLASDPMYKNSIVASAKLIVQQKSLHQLFHPMSSISL